MTEIPRGARRAVADWLLGHPQAGNVDPWEDARGILEAVLPLIERDVQRRTARQILTLHALDRGHICLRCHGKTIYDPSISALDPHAILRCVNGHEFPRRSNRGPFNDMDTSLRRLTRGEPLPDAPLPESASKEG